MKQKLRTQIGYAVFADVYFINIGLRAMRSWAAQ